MATMRDLDELALAQPGATKEAGKDGRPRYVARKKWFVFHRSPRKDAPFELPLARSAFRSRMRARCARPLTADLADRARACRARRRTSLTGRYVVGRSTTVPLSWSPQRCFVTSHESCGCSTYGAFSVTSAVPFETNEPHGAKILPLRTRKTS